MAGVPAPNKAQPGNEIFMMIGIKTFEKPELRDLFAVDHYTHTIDAAARMLSTQVQFLRPGNHRTYPSASAKEMPIIVIDRSVAMRGHPFDGTGQFLGEPKVVGVNKGNISSTSCVQGQVAQHR